MRRRLVTSERSIAVFCFGLLLFTPPVLSIFSVEKFGAGLPLLYLYYFIAWALLILLTALVCYHDRVGPKESAQLPPHQPETDR